MNNDKPQLSKGIQETSTTSSEMKIVLSGQTYTQGIAACTTTTSNPIVLVDDDPSVELSAKRLCHFLNSPPGLTFSVKAAELLFMCTGLEGSKHSEVIKKALQVDDIAATGFSYEFTAHDSNVFDPNPNPNPNLPELRLLPNALKNFEVAFFSALSKVENKSKILQPVLSTVTPHQPDLDHDKLLQVLQKYRNDSTDHNSLTSTNIAGLLNLWDFGLNRSVRPFLETISSCFTDHVALFLFINIKDIDKLYTPPSRASIDFSWRPKIQYLLRPVCQLMSDERRTKVKCTIFLTYDSSITEEINELEKAYQRLSSVCAVAFQQMEIEEEKLKFEVCKIAHNESCILLLEKMQSYAKEMKKTDIPCSHLLLRCILACAFQNQVLIKQKDLQDIAMHCSGFRPQDLKKFCESFTAFGSIIDVGLINPNSDHIIIKPSAFLDGLQRYIKKVNEDGSVYEMSPSISNLSEEQIVEVLVDIGMAYRYTDDDLKDLPKLSSAFAFNRHVKHNKRAIQFISNMGTPRLNINIDLMKYLISNVWPRYKILHRAANATTIRIPLDSPSPVQPIIDHIDICFTFLANVIEISFDAPKHIPVSHIRAVCGEVIAAFKQIIIKKRKQRNNSSIKYHFAILCKKDEIHGVYNAYRIRHVLPEKLCEDCYQVWKQDEISLLIVDVWRQLLEQGMGDHEKANDYERYSIPHELKLNGDLTMANIVMLSKGLAENFDWKAVKILANELEVMIIKKDPVTVHRKELIILEILVRWEHDNYHRKSESLRKIMARKLLDAAEKCETLTKEKGSLQLKADFKKLARDLDMTVLTKEQRKELNPTEPAKQE